MQLFLGVMTKDTRVQSTNHPTSKLLERVVVTLMGNDSKEVNSTAQMDKKVRIIFFILLSFMCMYCSAIWISNL